MKKYPQIRIAGSIFSGGGLGDVGIEWGSGIPVLAACELVPSRAALIRQNFPQTQVFEGDIWNLKNDYIDCFQNELSGEPPWLLTLSPPCQGMSSNGAGRISAAIRDGKRPKEDERNRLILPGIEVLEVLKPHWFILENVRRMENTVIRNERNQSENILACLTRRMHPLGYTLRSCILDFRNYGVPHHRERLITIGCRIPQIVSNWPQVADVLCSGSSPFHPLPTHGEGTNQDWITLRDTIGHLPPLDSKINWKDVDDPFHCVPKWNDNQYFWMKNTSEGQTAFDNAYCVDCGTMKTSPQQVLCIDCKNPLPVPQMKKSGKARLIKGFRSSYRRMRWDRPAGTLTMNSGVISSDLKGHPEQNRVLSLREILRLSTLDHEQWKKNYDFSGVPLGKWDESQSFSTRLVREVIGESIPPLAMKCMVDHLLRLEISTE
jgi:DNA (cytosine-5)-methyltransferase 1